MKNGNENDMKDLFERFMGREEAARAAEDISKGEQILRDFPAPSPDEETISRVKAEITHALVYRRVRAITRLGLRAAAVAAVVAITAIVIVAVFEKKEPQKPRVVATTTAMIPAISWESDTLADDDAEIAAIISEIDQIESEMIAMGLGENGGNGQTDSTDLEMELVEINSDFWKG
jgi:hypothetical protein